MKLKVAPKKAPPPLQIGDRVQVDAERLRHWIVNEKPHLRGFESEVGNKVFMLEDIDAEYGCVIRGPYSAYYGLPLRILMKAKE